jgi:hypothetical protein
MSIGRSTEPIANSVRRSGIQLELRHSCNSPLLRTESREFFSSIYKHITPSGVKPFNLHSISIDKLRGSR